MSEVRITDRYLVSAIEEERRRRGDKRATQTAGRLISERLTELGRLPVTTMDAQSAPAGDARTDQSALPSR